MFGFGRKRSRQRALALMNPFGEEFAKALRDELETGTAADEDVRIVKAAIRVAERALDDAVPNLQPTRSTPKPLVVRGFLEDFMARAAATARSAAAMKAVQEVGRRLGLSDSLSRLHDEVLGERMMRAAHRDAEADDSSRPFAHRLLAAAQSRAVYFQEVVKSAHAPESSVPVVPAAARANAAINVARRLEDEILGPASDD